MSEHDALVGLQCDEIDQEIDQEMNSGAAVVAANGPLTAAEEQDRLELLGRLNHVRKRALYEEAALVLEYKRKRLWRGRSTWEESSRRDLLYDVSQADELCRIYEARLKILEISRSGPMPPLPVRAYCWRPIVTEVPRIDDPGQIAAILQLAQQLAGPGQQMRWAEVAAAKDQVLGRPRRSCWFPGLHLSKRKHRNREEGEAEDEEEGEHAEKFEGDWKEDEAEWDEEVDEPEEQARGEIVGKKGGRSSETVLPDAAPGGPDPGPAASGKAAAI